MHSESRKKKFNDYLNSIPLEELRTVEQAELQQNKADFEKLKEYLDKGLCSYCGQSITHFSDKKPCFHWLLKPNGFKKKHFPLFYTEKSFHQIEAYLRWVANTEAPMKNINDLVEEGSSKKIIEETIKYKNLEWSFSCSQNDFNGHKDKFEGQYPHYHFQMKVDGNVIINYNGFHIPLDDYDFFSFDVKNDEFDRLKAGHIEGASIQTLFNNFSPEEIIDLAKNSDGNESKEDFSMQTLAIADEGTTISGEDLFLLMEESKKTGVSMAKLMQRLKNVTATTFISPGPGVPELAERTPNRRKGVKSHTTKRSPFPQTANYEDPYILSLCRKLVPNTQAFYLNVEATDKAIPKDCYGNVDRIIKEKGGKIQYGWQIWETMSDVMAEAEFHVVWIDNEGIYHDITPKTSPLTKILFLPDPNKKYEGKQIDNVRIALKKDPLIDRFIQNAEKYFEVTNKGDLANQIAIIVTPEMRELKREQQMLQIELLSKYFT